MSQKMKARSNLPYNDAELCKWDRAEGFPRLPTKSAEANFVPFLISVSQQKTTLLYRPSPKPEGEGERESYCPIHLLHPCSPLQSDVRAPCTRAPYLHCMFFPLPPLSQRQRKLKLILHLILSLGGMAFVAGETISR